jgi:membrane-associated phospholipid phosphatase
VPDPFVALKLKLAADDQAIRALYGTGLISLENQSILLERLKAGDVIPAGGISAMPSMHNAIAILAACAALEINRILGWLLVLFAALIFIGSIHLGWHYALDGVVAAIVSIGLWISSAALLRRYERRSQQRPNDPGNGRRASDQQPPADDSPVCACSSVSA